ncbi:MAG: response regulator transcription factor [Gallionella sp.]|nr:response regulator transcription factor [Gallionella sp.]
MHALPSNSLIRVALVEDNIDFQNALADAIRSAPDMVLQCVAATREQGLQMLDQLQADVLLVDLGLPDGSGVDVIRAAHAKCPDCNIVVCTVFGDEIHVMRSLEAGAAGYLLKDSSLENMLSGIRSLHAGGSPISPLIARQILMRFRQNDKPATPPVQLQAITPKNTLSARENEVLKHITRGYTSDESADLLGISRHTVQTYVRRIYGKLEVNSKAEAIFEARKLGLLGE